MTCVGAKNWVVDWGLINKNIWTTNNFGKT